MKQSPFRPLVLGTEAENAAVAAVGAAASRCPSIRKIMVYGSRVRGDFTDRSDLDLLVIVDDIAAREDVVRLLYGIETEYDVPLSPVIYTEKEFLTNRRLGSRFVVNVEKEGVTLYDSQRG